MSVNRYQPHILVLPEDDANRQIANGFHLQVESVRQRQLQVLPVAGGWNQVVNRFHSEHIIEMERCLTRRMVLLLDCDGDQNRLANVRSMVPVHLADRVFVLGVLTEPELLKSDLGSYEAIGSSLAADCREGTNNVWKHPLLQHNFDELDRMREHVVSILFQLN
jgi:hypothetical protein